MLYPLGVEIGVGLKEEDSGRWKPVTAPVAALFWSLPSLGRFSGVELQVLVWGGGVSRRELPFGLRNRVSLGANRTGQRFGDFREGAVGLQTPVRCSS
jgi:hypothetical protein